MNGHTIKEKVIDLWVSEGSGIYRLVDLGSGPLELQVQYGNEWRRERICYTHVELCDRIATLVNVKTTKGNK